MTRANRRGRAARLTLALALAALLLAGCAVAPPDTLVRSDHGDTPLIGAQTGAREPDTYEATLYFRYADTPYLAPETRMITRGGDESTEKALVRALLEGPGATSPSLAPLFPEGTQVLSATPQGDLLMVMFSEELLSRYADETGATSAAHWLGEARLRRKLAMDALTATLTGAGLCARVQVLVWRQTQATTTLRLPAGYLTADDDDTPLDPFTRDESVILTAHNTAAAALKAWLTQDWPALYGYLSAVGETGEARPGDQAAYADFAAAALLTSFTLSPGETSGDGKTCVLLADLSLRTRGGEDRALTAYPVRLRREGGLWKIDYARLKDMMTDE